MFNIVKIMLIRKWFKNPEEKTYSNPWAFDWFNSLIVKPTITVVLVNEEKNKREDYVVKEIQRRISKGPMRQFDESVCITVTNTRTKAEWQFRKDSLILKKDE